MSDAESADDDTEDKVKDLKLEDFDASESEDELKVRFLVCRIWNKFLRFFTSKKKVLYKVLIWYGTKVVC